MISDNNKADLIDTLLDFLKQNKEDEILEVKPDEHIYTYDSDILKNDIENIKKDNSTELDKQLMIVRK